MFTVKLFKDEDEERGSVQVSVSCQSYEVYRRKSGVITITTYRKMGLNDGVDWNISDEFEDYGYAFVMNDRGKTIDKILFQAGEPLDN